jgi:NADH-quinone oxidoreductase subunit N
MEQLNIPIKLLGPEIIFLALSVILFFGSMLKLRYGKLIINLCPIMALIAAATALPGFGYEENLFFKTYRLDGLSQFFKVLVSLGYLVAWFNCLSQKTVEEELKPDFYLFLTLSAFGLILLSGANELITIYLAMELSSYSLYVLIPVRSRSKAAAEAGIKYILFGAAATALALYGLSYIVASQNSTIISELSGLTWTLDNPLAIMGLTLFLGGLFFKLALFPFHFWCPDVYQGAANETAAYAATLPKLGAAIVLIRLAALLTPGEGLTNILAVLAAASITYGNLAALAQKDLKRMLGFSSVAHAGYILVGLVPGTAEGLAAASFYAMAYVLMNLLCFWVITRLATDGRNLTYQDLNGLSSRSPLLALALLVSAFSLVGLPPTVGFIGKLWLLTACWDHGYDWLVVVVCLNTAIAIFYYLSLVRHAYAEETIPAGGAQELALDNSLVGRLGALVLGLLILALGLVPEPIWKVVLDASKLLFR